LESPEFKKVVKIDLSVNQLGPQGTFALCQALANIPNVKSLNLAMNAMRDVGADCVAKLMTSNPLEEVNLSGNELSVRCVPTIAAAIASSASMKKLDLSINRIGSDGLILLSHSLSSSKVEEVSLRSTHIDSEAVTHLCTALMTSSAAKLLFLNSNNIGFEGCSSVAHLVTHGRVVRRVDLSGNPVQEEGAVLIHNLNLSRRVGNGAIIFK
jgi:Ran GTPase-activating protein (RanGAP) involved in mRNA processing and transport